MRKVWKNLAYIDKESTLSYQRKPTFNLSNFNLGCQSIKIFNCMIVMS